jgi:hypothetical protein
MNRIDYFKRLCAENLAARWLWKSGDLKKPNLIPWE